MSPIRRLVPLILLILAAAAALIVSACGDDGGGESAQATLKQTFSGDKQVNSGKLDLSFTAVLKAKGQSAQQLQDPVNVKVSGPFQTRGENALPALNLDLTAGSGAQSFTAGVISTGDEGFISYQGSFYRVPDKTFEEFRRNYEKQQRQDAGKKQPDLATLGVNAEQWLKDPKVEGDEEIGGVTTTHISSDIKVSALLADVNDLLKRADDLGLSAQQRQQLPAQLDAKTRRQLEKAVRKARVDVYTGKDDKILRKIVVHLEFESPEGLGGQAQDVQSGKIDLTLAVADLNKKQAIKPPRNAKSLSELQQQLGLLGLSSLGGASQGGSGRGSGAGSGSSAPSTGQDQLNRLKGLSGGNSGSGATDTKRAQDYLKCAKGADTVDQLQVCADKLK